MITVTVPPGHNSGDLQFALPRVSVAMIRYS
ncbi:MAG: hypothetical protein BMS9Abin20_0393 [Acidimicrobiia bacterium]|nr:MAG: hypothetical protein BMS9Abin20_0393 [Acidimicrobiia bacterium]